MSGLLHPVFGLDHLLAMLSVGIVSAQLGGRRIFTIPLVFVLGMITGAFVGVTGHGWPLTEIGIAVSVIVLGTCIATVQTDTTAISVMAAAAAFGCLHGHAHGLELPQSADPVYYGGGFLTSTAAIHVAGVGFGHALSHERRRSFLRHVGSGIVGIGLMILIDLLGTQ